MKSKPPLTPEQRAEKRRLRAFYESLKADWQKRNNGRYLSQTLLAEIIGDLVKGDPWSQGAINQFMNEKSNTKLPADVVQAMAEVLGFDPAEVGERFAPKEYVASAVLSKHQDRRSALQVVASGDTATPTLVKDVTAPYRTESAPSFVEIDWAVGDISAGPGRHASDDYERRSLAFSDSWLRSKGLKRKDLVIIKVHGESMEPRLSNGDVALINTADREIKDHKIYALRYGDDLRIKRLSTRYDGAIVISSDNPMPEFKDEVVPAQELPQLHVIGRAVWVGGEL